VLLTLLIGSKHLFILVRAIDFWLLTSAPVCFSGSSYVELEDNNDNKLMSSIKLGEKVLSYTRNSNMSMT
jgi:hypothetical protein